MLRKINKYSHGFVFIPVGVSLKQIGFFDYLSNNGPQGFSEIVNHFKANSGYLKACLDMLYVADWLDYVDGKYFLTGKSEENEYLPLDLLELYEFSPEELVSSREPSNVLKRWLGPLINGWGCEEPLSDMLDGVILIPLLLGLVRNDLVGAINNFDIDRLPFVAELRDVFISKKWANNKDGNFIINGVGKFMLGRCHVAGVTASYRPMLRRMKALLLGDSDAVMEVNQGLEQHVDRTLNVQSSAFQHEKYFKEIERAIQTIFNDKPLEEQPDYIVDMGCGNGGLLNSIYTIIKDKTIRGKSLVDRPVVLIGIDLNPEALTEASGVLQCVPHKLMHGDVSKPESILEVMNQLGIDDTSRMLHVRSFLDHNRIYYNQAETSWMNPWITLPAESFGIGSGGELIPFPEMMQNLSEHLRRWKSILGDYGLLCLEVHSQTYWSKKEYSDTSEGFHFDALHAFSKQYLCEPEYFIAAMAENGLFADEIFTGYPSKFHFTRITLGYYEKKPFVIRFISEIEAAEICSLNQLGSFFFSQERAKDLILKKPELCFFIALNGRTPEAAMFCKRGQSLGKGKYQVDVEAILCKDPKDMRCVEHLLDYVTRFMILKYDVGCIRGTAGVPLLSKLISLGAEIIDDDSLKEKPEYYLVTEN